MARIRNGEFSKFPPIFGGAVVSFGLVRFPLRKRNASLVFYLFAIEFAVR